MTNEQTKELALRLLSADSESDVIEILQRAGYWESPHAWRLVGDREGNFATIGAQQSRPEAALVEKIVNSVDARLMNECLIRGIDPKSEQAPPSIRHAVSRFFENREPRGELGGTLQGWSQTKQLDEAQFITLAVTGATPRSGEPRSVPMDHSMAIAAIRSGIAVSECYGSIGTAHPLEETASAASFWATVNL